MNTDLVAQHINLMTMLLAPYKLSPSAERIKHVKEAATDEELNADIKRMQAHMREATTVNYVF